MKIVYAGQEMPEKITKSVFLAGPTPRSKEVESWRKDAVKILEDIGFDGTVFIPEGPDGEFKLDYDDQIAWEEKHLKLCDCILFWVPRDLSLDSNDMPKMAGLTTNVEFGFYADSGKVVFGAPENADKISYLKLYAEKFNVAVADTLTETVQNAIDYLGTGAERSGGERYVPLFIWNTPSFQSWYSSQKEVGNRLDYADLLYSFRPKFKSFVFLWILNVDVYIKSEDRNKTNEFVLARPDISSVLLYHSPNGADGVLDYEVVVVKEFRSPANTDDGFIRELIGGSSAKPGEDPKEVAAHETFEETSFHVKPERLQFKGARQLAGTLSSHKAHLYSLELDEEEIKWFKSQDGIVHGNEKDSERTFIEVHTLYDLVNNKELGMDFSNLGMILSVLAY